MTNTATEAPWNDHHIRRAQPGSKMEALCGHKAAQDKPLVCGPPSMATCWRCIVVACGRPVPAEPAMPEHDRLTKAKKTDDATTLVGEFFDWLVGEKGYVLGMYMHPDHEELTPTREPVVKLLAEFFGIDENALEGEKRALLDHLREINATVTWARTEGRRLLKDL